MSLVQVFMCQLQLAKRGPETKAQVGLKTLRKCKYFLSFQRLCMMVLSIFLQKKFCENVQSRYCAFLQQKFFFALNVSLSGHIHVSTSLLPMQSRKNVG